MEHVVNTLIPLFALIVLGYLVRRFNLLGVKSAKILNIFVMKIALPTLIFGSVATQRLSAILNWRFMLAFSLILLIPYICSFFIGRIRRSESSSQSALRALALSLPNIGYLGIPLMRALHGQKGVLIASIATFLSVLVIVPTMIICDTGKKRGDTIKTMIQKTALTCCTNPLVIAVALGFLYSLLRIPMIGTLQMFIQLIGNVADPCALFALGELIFGQSLKKGLREVGLNSFMKLAAQPCIGLVLLWGLEVEKTWAMGGFLLSALPTGIIVSVLVDYYQTYFWRGLTTILVTTLLSFGTLLFAFYLSSKIWGSPLG